ncbi:helix-turn-helix domain-containing protein [Ideonella livida]|uniref:Helix-turn-helix domain-containing protein n=1 Tax=Ideonella livida TaxID=2707176 RepID=A0A7C9TH11_9BURK|nr:helix-turn-helix domain-containing protein [Ideonella livida]NDY90058.1 helix-turn-helix domain-containing protein [Ideonella livida]
MALAAHAAALPAPAPTPGWHALRRRQAQDVDEQAALLQGWQQDYAQVSAGPFEGEVEELRLDDPAGWPQHTVLHLFVEHTGQRLLQRGALPPGLLALGIPLELGTAGQAVTFCGATDWMGPQAGARWCTFSGAGGFEFATPSGLRMTGVEVSLDWLGAGLQPEEQACLATLAAQPGLRSAPLDTLAAWREWLAGALTLLRQDAHCLDSEATRQALRATLRSNLLELLTLDAGPAPAVDALPQWTLVQRAQAHVRADPETPHTVADLCQALGVSRRTLQAAFQKVLGLAPACWLRSQRLAGAHRALRSEATRSVAEAATQWGFWHLGLFARDYRRQFGRLPSQDLRRAAH